MRFNDDTRTRLTAELTITRDPATSTVTLKVNGQFYAAGWLAAAVTGTNDAGDPVWTQELRTTGWFAGASVPADQLAGATVLADGVTEPLEAIVVWPDGERASFEIDILDVG